MGQKVNPKAFRLGITRSWDSKWFARGRAYAATVQEDMGIKKFLFKELKNAGISNIEIERTANALTIIITSARPGVIIGRMGSGAEELKKKIQKTFFLNRKILVNLSIFEVDNPVLDARLVMQGMIEELQKRVAYRRVMKQAIDRVSKGGAQGVKVIVGGRLNGAEIAKREMLVWGKVPLHTFRADIDFCRGTARTMAGAVGVKVWIYRGDIFNEKKGALK